jgi:hypothetical protein
MPLRVARPESLKGVLSARPATPFAETSSCHQADMLKGLYFDRAAR